MLGRASSGFSANADGVRIVDKNNCAVFVRHFNECIKRCQVTFHAEHAVGRDNAKPVPLVLVFFEKLVEVCGICVIIDFLVRRFGLSKTHAVDDAGVIQPIRVNSILVIFYTKFFVYKACEKSFVRGKAR